ncbi:MAG: hypothetical protein ACHP84_15260 [Caulobacterales bacterium]
MPPRLAALALLTLLAAAPAGAQDDPGAWTTAAARGAFDLCREDAPDAARVAEHGEVWGWPRFAGYVEHPIGFKREAGGESVRSIGSADKPASVELGVQSGVVTSAAPVLVRYFRCNVASNLDIRTDLVAYFTDAYGPPASRSDATVVWEQRKAPAGAPQGQSGGDVEADLVKTIAASLPGTKVTRVELTRERGVTRARLSWFENAGPAPAP